MSRTIRMMSMGLVVAASAAVAPAANAMMHVDPGALARHTGAAYLRNAKIVCPFPAWNRCLFRPKRSHNRDHRKHVRKRNPRIRDHRKPRANVRDHRRDPRFNPRGGRAGIRDHRCHGGPRFCPRGG